VHLLSPAQLVGYLALVLGVAGFLQTDDRRLKLLVGLEGLAYVVHFALLGVPSAAGSAAVSGLRTLLSMRIRSAWLAAASVAATLAVPVLLSTRGAGWLPVVGSVLGAIAVCLLRGLTMRLVLLAATSCWLANGILSGSVGGTVLESLILTASLVTIVRMAVARRVAARADPAQAAASP
jgi:hypothetical protein